MSGHRARKRFGQNFLVDQVVIERIIKAVNPKPGEHIVEIGPGQGAITRPLLHSGARLTVIEIDRDLVASLSADPALAGATVMQADALKVDFAALAADGPLRVVGNLPYNISTPLLFHLLKASDCLLDAHFMLQAEVVARMQAAPGNKTYGRLSVMLQYYCQVDALFQIGPQSFRPAPRVESAMARLRPRRNRPQDASDLRRFDEIVRAAFAQRRKQLGNSLRGVVEVATLRTLDIDPARRAETLAPADYVALANASVGNP